MQHKKEARRAMESKRATVHENGHSISQKEWERGCLAFGLVMLAGWCAMWLMEVFA